MLSKSILRLKRAFSSAKYYDSCLDLPLFRFIKAFDTDDLNYLVISGYPTVDQLKKAWEKIYSEYCQLSNDKTHDYLLKCLKDISFLSNKLYLIEAIVNQLTVSRSQALVEQLNQMGFRFKYEVYGSERYTTELKLTVTQSKQMLFRLRERQKALEKLRTATGDKRENEYDLLLTELSKFQGYRIDPHITTVSEFVAIVNRFKEANTPKNGSR